MKKPPPDGLQLTLNFDPVEVLIQVQESGSGVGIDNLWWGKILAYRGDMLKAAKGKMNRPEDAEDIVQDALIVANEKRSKYRDDQNLCGWLCTITRNLAVNKYQKEKNRPTEYVGDSEVFKGREGGEGLIESFQFIEDFSTRLNALDDATKSIVELHLEGKKTRDIEKETGLTVRKITKLRKMGLFKLKTALKAYQK